MPQRCAVGNDNPFPIRQFRSANCILVEPACGQENASGFPGMIKQHYRGGSHSIFYPACSKRPDQDKIPGWSEQQKPAH
jgi:hypothetical protein